MSQYVTKSVTIVIIQFIAYYYCYNYHYWKRQLHSIRCNCHFILYNYYYYISYYYYYYYQYY